MDQHTVDVARHDRLRDLAQVALVEYSDVGMRARGIEEREATIETFEESGHERVVARVREELTLLVDEGQRLALVGSLPQVIVEEVTAYMDQCRKPHPLVVELSGDPLECSSCGEDRSGFGMLRVSDPLDRLGGLELVFCRRCVDQLAVSERDRIAAAALTVLRVSSEPLSVSRLERALRAEGWLYVYDDLLAALRMLVDRREVRRERGTGWTHWLYSAR